MQSHFPRKKRAWVILSLFLFSAAEWTLRGPVRAFNSSPEYNDFLSPYVQTKVWLGGQNPYDLDVLARAWPYQNSSLQHNLISRGIPSPYPLTGFPLLAPFAAFSWNRANLLWQLSEMFFFVLLLTSWLYIAKNDAEQNFMYLLVPAALAFAPFHTGLAVENVALTALALATSAIACEQRKHRVLAGLLLGCGLALKPTVAIPALAYFLTRKRWSSVFASTATCLALLLVASGRMMLSGTEWLPTYLENGKHLFDAGTIYDFSGTNPLRFDLVNAQVIFAQLTTRALAQYFAMGIAGLAVLGWLGWRTRWRADQPLLDLSLLSVVMLVPVYHRFYDAALLVFPMAWAITNLRGTLAHSARTVLIASTPFLIPGAAVLRWLEESNDWIATLSRSWWWNVFVAAHQAWLILIILTALLLAVRKMSQPEIQQSVFESAPAAA